MTWQMCSQAVLRCQKHSWHFCAGQAYLLTLMSLHLALVKIDASGRWYSGDVTYKEGRGPWLLCHTHCYCRQKVNVFCSMFWDQLKPFPLFSLAMFLECEVQENSLGPRFRGPSYRLDILHLPSSCPGCRHANVGRTAYTQTVLHHLQISILGHFKWWAQAC